MTSRKASGLQPLYDSSFFDGILGFAFPALSIGSLPTVIQNLVSQNKIERALIGFYLATGSSGELSIGTIDDSKFLGNLTYFPVIRKSYWELGLKRIYFGSNVLGKSSSIIIDSGTSFLVPIF